MQIYSMTLDFLAPVNPKQYKEEIKQIEAAEKQALSDLIEEQNKWDSNPQRVESELLCKST